MTFTLPRDLRGTETLQRVEALLRAMREPGVGRVVDASDLACSPDGRRLQPPVAAVVPGRGAPALRGPGFLAAWLATRPGRFAAALASSPVTDWVSQHYTTNIPQSDVRFLHGHPLDVSSHYRSRSPLTAASAGTCPVLLTAGHLDLATPPGQALEMHRALAELGVDTDIALYPREGHDVHEWPAVVDHCTRMVLWFDHFLRPG